MRGGGPESRTCHLNNVTSLNSAEEEGEGNFENIVREPFFGFELSDFSADDIYFCGGCEFDEESDAI